MQSFYIVGGQQKYLCPVFVAENWSEYHKGIVIQIDTRGENSRVAFDYVSPDHAAAEPGAMLFKAASITDQYLYLCTQTEILIFRVPGMKQVGYITLPYFNDVHHVTETPHGTLAVAISGLDMVAEVSREGEPIREWNVLGGSPWTKFSRDIDYRQAYLKPHASHPNYVFFLDDEMWVTRFYQKDAISLTSPGRRMDVAVGAPHDGIVVGDYTYFTTTNGHVVVFHNRTLKAEQVLDLNAIHRHGGPLGWSRGIYVENDRRIWVGFSRIRPTKLKENLDWVKHTLKWRLRAFLPDFYKERSGWMKQGPKNQLPTRLVCYDPVDLKCVSEMNLEPHGVSAVFSIFPAAAMGQITHQPYDEPDQAEMFVR